MKVLILIFSLLLAFQSRASEPLYKIDLDFLKTPSTLQNGSEADADAYNSDSANQTAHPVFTEDAVLEFPNRHVRVHLIASRHDGLQDAAFIAGELKRLNVDPKSVTLFMEQADPLAANGSLTKMISELHAKAPELDAAVARAKANPRSSFSRPFNDSLTFARVAQLWESQGGSVVNMDLAQNFEPAAIAFLSAQLESAAVFRFLRIELDRETFAFPDLQKLMQRLYSPPLQPKAIANSKDCCGTPREWINTFLTDNHVRDLVRERFMRVTLASQINDGDVIITHPVHMRHILSHEQMPDRMFERLPDRKTVH